MVGFFFFLTLDIKAIKIEKSGPEVVQFRTQGLAKKGKIQMNSIVSQNSNPIKPQMVDGIELYATDSECGMSQRGLARFCGVDEANIRRLLDSMVRGCTSSESLNRFAGQDLYCGVEGEKGAKIIKSQVCSAICKYYALESKAKNETAMYSLCKFSDLGIDSWIRDVTGHSLKPALNPHEIALQLSMELIEVQRQLNESQARLIAAAEVDKIKSAFINQGEGMAMMFERFDEDDHEFPREFNYAGEEKLYTIKEYLSLVQEVNLDTIPRGTLTGYGRKVAETFKSHNIELPPEIQPKRGGKCRAYRKRDFPMLAAAWESFRRDRAKELTRRM
jgi:hypothetical protein